MNKREFKVRVKEIIDAIEPNKEDEYGRTKRL